SGQPPPFDRLTLRGNWACFESSPEVERILLAFAHPGAQDGHRQYFLYLRTPPEKGRYYFHSRPGEEASSVPRPDDARQGAVCGFYLQRQGPLAGLTRLAAGTIQITGSPFDGGKLRIGRFEMACADGTLLKGRFTARQNHLEMRTFEEDLYPADVQALIDESDAQPADPGP
ncbi:MAG: hypothetical protein JSU68_09845, partial [Phycisphaerales bacterium]